jgi:hypothetical protein
LDLARSNGQTAVDGLSSVLLRRWASMGRTGLAPQTTVVEAQALGVDAARR